MSTTETILETGVRRAGGNICAFGQLLGTCQLEFGCGTSYTASGKMLVLAIPGQMALTRMPWSRSAAGAMLRVQPITPCLEAA